MYLNLDLLYNVNNYLYPLFYYNNKYDKEVYSPMTKKFIFISDYNIYFDFITKKYGYLTKIFDFNNTNCIFTENTVKQYRHILYKCKAFRLKKKTSFS